MSLLQPSIPRPSTKRTRIRIISSHISRLRITTACSMPGISGFLSWLLSVLCFGIPSIILLHGVQESLSSGGPLVAIHHLKILNILWMEYSSVLHLSYAPRISIWQISCSAWWPLYTQLFITIILVGVMINYGRPSLYSTELPSCSRYCPSGVGVYWIHAIVLKVVPPQKWTALSVTPSSYHSS